MLKDVISNISENTESASKYKKNRRKIDPAVYNKRRLTEKPLPATQTQKVQEKSSSKTSNGSKVTKQSKRQSTQSKPEQCVQNSPAISLGIPPVSPQRTEPEEDESISETQSETDVI